MQYDGSGIAAGYDRGRDYHGDVLQRWLEAVAARVPPAGVRHVIDLGCGTGRYSPALAAHFAARVTGIDPSAEMLARARAKPAPGVCYLRGGGEAIPLGAASTDLVFLSMIYHHLADPPAVARECARVLRPGGHVALRNGLAERAEDYAYAPYFDGMAALIRRRMPSAAAVEAAFAGAGLSLLAHDVVTHQLAPTWTAWAERLSHRVDSLLVSLPDQVFARGLAAIRARAAADGGDAPVSQPIDLLVFQAGV